MEKTLSRRSVQIGGCTDRPPIRVSSTLPRESTLGRYIDDIILHTVCSTGARQKIKVILNILFSEDIIRANNLSMSMMLYRMSDITSKVGVPDSIFFPI